MANIRTLVLPTILFIQFLFVCSHVSSFCFIIKTLDKNHQSHDTANNGFFRGAVNTRLYDVSTQVNNFRGERYNNGNSTLPSPKEVAQRLGVKPTSEVPAKTWQRAWKVHKRLIPLLHCTDSCKPPDSSLNIACMWWKALSGNDQSSPVYDDGLAYDLLPSGWRKLVKFNRFYPRLHHANVELRTAYLDNAVFQIVSDIKEVDATVKILLICMGAGYDTRGVKMLERGIVDSVIEMDLPEVVKAKNRLMNRLWKRRPSLNNTTMPKLIPVDFNKIPGVQRELKRELGSLASTPNPEKWHTIFVFEGVMIYLDENIPSTLLNITSSALKGNSLDGSLCFADRLENVPGGDRALGELELQRNGWLIKDWCPKPGLARHMGSARLVGSEVAFVGEFQ
mmetsp:Transcript_47/g.89  ORF Transcript_47/g.89 Transcript_47/m.89 type:complete len:394 (+) Transcript_47:1662-2843(+)